MRLKDKFMSWGLALAFLVCMTLVWINLWSSL